jgi:hypothetical protein
MILRWKSTPAGLMAVGSRRLGFDYAVYRIQQTRLQWSLTITHPRGFRGVDRREYVSLVDTKIAAQTYEDMMSARDNPMPEWGWWAVAGVTFAAIAGVSIYLYEKKKAAPSSLPSNNPSTLPKLPPGSVTLNLSQGPAQITPQVKLTVGQMLLVTLPPGAWGIQNVLGGTQPVMLVDYGSGYVVLQGVVKGGGGVELTQTGVTPIPIAFAVV